MNETIIIIGAGIAGLAAGCYAQMNGYKTKIFELHDLPGGLCTAWERQDYIFDGCIHYLVGTADGQAYHQIWQELGADQGRPILHHSEFMRVKSPDGKDFIVYTDPDQLDAHMKSLSPADAGLISNFTRAIKHFTRFNMAQLQAKPKSMMGLVDWTGLGLTMMPFAPDLIKWAYVEAGDFAKRFKDPFLQRAIPLIGAWQEIPMLAVISLMAYMYSRNAGYPAGASLAFARSIEKRYLELGGEIHYKSQVEKILVEDDRAVGVRLYNDDIYHADLIISAADGRATIYELLEGKFVNREIEKLYNGSLEVMPQIQVSLGVARDLKEEPHWINYLLEKPIIIAGEERDVIGVKNYCFDPSLAPPGKSVVEVLLRTNYGYWQRIYGHRLYDTEQNQVADIVVEFLEKIYPGIKQQVEVIDVATPLSYERYTGNFQGSNCGWLLTKKSMLKMLVGISKTLPGLQNFYMAGQWVEPGGMVPVVAMSGKNVIQMICAADKRSFKTTI